MRKTLTVFITLLATTTGYAQHIDWAKVDEQFGRKATITGEVRRYALPRSDLQVKVDDVLIRPALALGSWVAFKPAHGGAMVMGDLVLLETEISPVMTKLVENGIDITAIHNHVLRANPPVVYMHIGAHGDPIKLATGIRAALAESKTPVDMGVPSIRTGHGATRSDSWGEGSG
jgi:hypothetical protein